MTSPRGRVDAARLADAPPASNVKRALLLLALIFAAIFLLHLPLLRLPYYWDEAGYFVPAARDLLLTGDPVPHSTLSNAHPPLVMAYLALAWRLFGQSIFVARTAMLLVAAFALLGVYCLAERVANRAVAWATVVLTALYPVFFAQSSLAHLDMMVAALTVWALWFYLPPRDVRADAGGESATRDEATAQGGEAARDEGKADEGKASGNRSINPSGNPLTGGVRLSRRVACVALLALAGITKETAILTPLTLLAWEFLCWLMGRKRETPHAYCISPRGRGGVAVSFLFLLALLPLALWFAYHYGRTGYVLGNPEYFRYNVASTVNPARILYAGLGRLWHATGYMNLFVLTGAMVLAMFHPPLRDAGVERGRIDVGVQLVFAVLIVAHVVALSVVGGAVLARYMLPVLPLVILVCVSTLWRRVRRWPLAVGMVCAGFVLALFVNPPVRFPWEDNLAYRDFILLHEQAGKFLSERYPTARVLTAWPATDELKNPYYGYTERAFDVAGIEHFSTRQLSDALRDQTPFDVVLLFSTNYADDLSPDAAAQLLGGHIVYRDKRRGHWVAVVEMGKDSKQ